MPGVFIRLLGPGYVGIRYPSATGGLQVLIEERTGDTEQCSFGAAVWALAAALHNANFGLWACTTLAAVWALAAALHNANFGPWACTALAAALADGIGCSLA